jgi:hypothetical protein
MAEDALQSVLAQNGFAEYRDRISAEPGDGEVTRAAKAFEILPTHEVKL